MRQSWDSQMIDGVFPTASMKEVFMFKTQYELNRRVEYFDRFVSFKWNEYSETMRRVVLESRRALIKELQHLQLKEFDRER